MNSSFTVVVPTLNAGADWITWISALQRQSITPLMVFILDSESSDSTVEISTQANFIVKSIPRTEFNHGETRQIAVDNLPSEVNVLVFMTQDALLADPDALLNLLEAFKDSDVAAAYGRQLPHTNASPLASHLRLFNYQNKSRTITLDDRESLGIKACFLSNSFAAYRVSDLLSVGGFPRNVVLGEDTSVAARLLLAGKAIRYQADACVYHSHNYTPLEEFRRYFDTGVFHARERWLLDAFGSAGGEGFRFVTSELRYLMRKAPWLIPSALLRTASKLAGYRLGRAEARLPVSLKRRLSMFRAYWS